MKPLRASGFAIRSLMMPIIRSSDTKPPEAMIGAACWPSGVPPATASRSMSPVEMWGMSKRLASRFAWVPLPLPGGPMKMIFNESASTSADAALLHEAVVMAHDQLGLDLLHRVHGHAYDDQQRGAAEVEAQPHALGDPERQDAIEERADAERELLHVDTGDEELRQDADRGEVDRADEGDARQHAVDVVR